MSSQQHHGGASNQPESSSMQLFQQRLDRAIQTVLKENFDADSKTCFLTLLKVLDNILKTPHNPKVRSLRTQNSAIRSKIIERHGHNVLLACGFVLEKDPAGIGMPEGSGEERLVLHYPGESSSSDGGSPGEDAVLQRLVKARHTLARIGVLELRIPADSLPKFRYQPPPKIRSGASNAAPTNNNSFDIYQGRRFDGQSASVGTNLGPPANWKSKTEEELAELKRREERLEREFALGNASNTTNTAAKRKPMVERQWTVVMPGQTASSGNVVSSSATASASGDSQLLASHFQRQHAKNKAAQNRGFTTKAMRDREKLLSTKVYSHTQLAIAFPDACVVRANFGTSETVAAVLDGLKQNVLLPVEGCEALDLYQTPPRTVLDPAKTLKELGLLPAARVYVSWKKPSPAGPRAKGWYLRPELLSNQGGATAAMPTSVAVAGNGGNKTQKANPKPSVAAKPKKTKAEKEAALMKRMLGGKKFF